MNKIRVTKSTLPDFDKYVKRLRSIWDSAWLTNMGAQHRELEERLEDFLDVKHIVLFANGHLALELLIQAMELKGEIITTPFSFASTTHAIVRNGIEPVFCDIREDDFTMDVDRVEELITERTSAILPVHVYGNICRVEELDRLAKKHGIKLIYDAAHTFAEKIDSRGIGDFGDASMFSFHATKVFNTIEGGAICTEDENLVRKLKALKNFGIADEEHVLSVGSNAKMNEFQAAMGLCNLENIREHIDKRRLIVERYLDRLSDVKGIRLNIYNSNIEYNYAYMPVIVENIYYKNTRDKLYDALAKEHIYARKYFYPCINEYDCYKHANYRGDTPIARRIASQVLTLPLYPELGLDVVDRICDIIKRKMQN